MLCVLLARLQHCGEGILKIWMIKHLVKSKWPVHRRSMTSTAIGLTGHANSSKTEQRWKAILNWERFYGECGFQFGHDGQHDVFAPMSGGHLDSDW